MSRSLSLILPVRNVEQQLSGAIARVLEILPDITRHFEILIIDQGSSDHTLEIAEDLATEYPQIRIGSAMSSDAIQFGIQQSRGEVVISHDGAGELNSADLARLCNSVQPQAVLAGSGRKSWRPEPAQTSSPAISTTSLRLHDRDTIARLRRSVAAVQQLSFPRALPTLPAAPVKQMPKRMQPRSNPTDQKPVQRGPNYLSQLRERLQKLVTGE